MSGSTSVLDWLTLSCLPGVGPVTLCALVRRFPDPSVLFARSRRLQELSPSLRRLLDDRASLAQARDAARCQLDAASRQGVTLICFDDARYPALLREIPDPPPLLFVRGDPSCLHGPTVAVVGARTASAYGRAVAFELGRDLAAAGVCVVSGLALGIDGQAHAGALDAQGETAGVLGCGVDVIYPRRHASLHERIGDTGVLISEYACGTRPDGFRFPARNRIIAGLSLGVVVVEATARSGSLITARLALDQGREVLAVPGRVDSVRSDGCHRLIQAGAFLVRHGDDILAALGLDQTDPGPEAGSGDEDRAGLTPEEQKILAALDVYGVDVDTLARSTGLATGELMSLLLRLELEGRIRILPGQMVELVSSRAGGDEKKHGQG